MALSRAVCATLAVALLGSAGWGWRSGGRGPARFDATVVHVSDGDTITVEFGTGGLGERTEKVRILGADTPEVVDPRKPVQCYGPEASAYTKARLAPGTRVTLETDAEVRDKYGRLLAYVYVGDARYDDELLRLGFARLLIIPPNGVHARAMLGAELEARAARRGLWGVCH
jgi:micrococcal nuclease